MAITNIAKRRGRRGDNAQPCCRPDRALLIFFALAIAFYALYVRSLFPSPSSLLLPSKTTPSLPEDSLHNLSGDSSHQVNNNSSELRRERIKSSTPPCHPHTTKIECTGFCQVVGAYIKGRREDRNMWHWYYPNILKYYECNQATIVVEVGAAFGGQTQYMLKHGRNFLKEYHVVDPFMAGYDRKDTMSRWMQKAAPDASPADISNAWYKSISLALGTNGEYFDEGMDPAGCVLRMHRLKSVEGARLFGNHSIDAVFIDGLHTYEGVVDDINAWRDKLKPGGAMIFNDYNMQKQFGGISKAVKEEASRRATPFMIDRTNAVLGGKPGCATKPVPF